MMFILGRGFVELKAVGDTLVSIKQYYIDASSVPIQRLNTSKAALEEQMCPSGIFRQVVNPDLFSDYWM